MGAGSMFYQWIMCSLQTSKICMVLIVCEVYLNNLKFCTKMRSCYFACFVPCRAVFAMLRASWLPFGLQGVWTKAEHDDCVLSLWPAPHPHGCGDPQLSHNGYGLHPSHSKRIFPLRRGKMSTKMTMHANSLSPSTWGKKQENTKMGGFCLVGMSWDKG